MDVGFQKVNLPNRPNSDMLAKILHQCNGFAKQRKTRKQGPTKHEPVFINRRLKKQTSYKQTSMHCDQVYTLRSKLKFGKNVCSLFIGHWPQEKGELRLRSSPSTVFGADKETSRRQWRKGHLLMKMH